jgi:spore maturation protein SpmB
MAANALGLTNAATPFGIRAIQELDKLNTHKGTATNAMVLFLAINTSAVTLLPTGVIALRVAAGSNDPAGILPTTLFASALSTLVGITAAKLYQRWSPVVADDDAAAGATTPAPSVEPSQGDVPTATADEAYPVWASMTGLAVVAAAIVFAIIYGREVAPWIIPALVILLLGFGMARGVRVYEVLVDGGREGFQVAVRIIPYIVAILVAVGMFRASGALDMLVASVGPVTSPLGLPAEALPMALLRPLSGQGAFGVLAATIQDPAIGPDSYTGFLLSTMQGATDTTFYILAVYFGAVQVRRIRHALAAGLSADVAGIAGAIIACSYLYG